MAYLNRTTLIDKSGNTYGSYTDADGDYCMAVSAIQNVTADAKNTSSANLPSGATWNGTANTTLGVASIQVMFKCDQYCTVTICQSGDGTNFDVADSFKYIPGQNFGMTVQTVGKSYYVSIINNGPITTTTFRVEAFLCPMVEAVPRAPDQFGNLRVGVNGLADQYGFLGQFDQVRQLSVEEPYRLVGPALAGADSNFWTTANYGTGSAVDIASTTPDVCTLTSGTANNGNASLASVRKGRFIFRSPNRLAAFVRIPTLAAAANTCNWGVGLIGSESASGITVTDGFWFGWNGSGTASTGLSLNWRNASGAVQTVSSGSFNGQVSQFTMDANYHTYEICYSTAGTWFFIDGILLYSVQPATALLSSTMTLNAIAWTVNGAGGTTSQVMQVSSLSIYRLGREMTEKKSVYISATTGAGGQALKIGPGLLHRAVFGSLANNGGELTLYDGTTTGSAITGTILWDSGLVQQKLAPSSVDFAGIPFATGLVALVTAQAMPVTLVYE